MDIGIGIPNSVRDTRGPQLLEWARRADAAGFSSLATIGRVAYPNYEELTVLAAAGAVTERIRLLPNILLAPTRSTAELAKQAATVQELSGGRLTLGIGVGSREDDYLLTGRDFRGRGRVFDQQLADLRRAFAGEPLVEGGAPVVPAPGNVPILIGGASDAAVRRTVEYGIGWTAGGAPPQMVAPFVERVRGAWRDAGRGGLAPDRGTQLLRSRRHRKAVAREPRRLLPDPGARDGRDDRLRRPPLARGDQGRHRGVRGGRRR